MSWGLRPHAMRLLSILAVLIGGCTSLAPPVRAADAPIAQTAIPRTEQRVGRTDPSRMLTLSVPLTVSDSKGLDAFLANLYNPSSASYHRFLTPAAFTQRFVDPTARKDVAGFLRGKGFTVSDPGVGTVITATATAAQAERAFNVTLSDYTDGAGRTFYASDKTPALPASVAPRITGIVGLDNASPDSPHFLLPPLGGARAAARATVDDNSHLTGAVACPAAQPTISRYHSYAPNQIAAWYGFDSFTNVATNGEAQSVALFEEDDFRDADVQAYRDCFGGAAPVMRIPVDGGTAPGTGEDEVELDIELLVGMVPRLGQMFVYESPNTSAAAIDQYQRIANDDAAQVVSTSWGNCEPNRTSARITAEDAIFRQMAAQGQSLLAAAGDNGSQDCGSGSLAVDDPASQPYVTGVGGTTLEEYESTVEGPGGEYAVWNNGIGRGGAGGGGLSAVWPKPAYQAGSAAANHYSNGMRQVPDVSASADPAYAYTVYVHDPTNCPIVAGAGATDCFLPIAGTSAAAPLWASIAALTNQYIVARGQPVLGFMNPTLYRLLGGVRTFNEINQGTNCHTATCGGSYPAVNGYDEAAGIGVPHIQGFLKGLLTPAPQITSIDPVYDVVGFEAPVTIHGANFTPDSMVIFGDPSYLGISYTILSLTSTEIVFTPPLRGIGAVDVTVQTDGGFATLSHSYTYYSPDTPAILGISPQNGSEDGGDIVTITGLFLSKDFGTGFAVLFDGAPATIISSSGTQPQSQVVVRTPPHAPGMVDVSATNGLTSSVAPKIFRYDFQPGSVIPGAAPSAQPDARSGPSALPGVAPAPVPLGR